MHTINVCSLCSWTNKCLLFIRTWCFLSIQRWNYQFVDDNYWSARILFCFKIINPKKTTDTHVVFFVNPKMKLPICGWQLLIRENFILFHIINPKMYEVGRFVGMHSQTLKLSYILIDFLINSFIFNYPHLFKFKNIFLKTFQQVILL